MGASMFCRGCDTDKPEAAFSFRNKAAGTRLSRCKSCQATYRKRHYRENRDALIARQQKINASVIERNRAFVYEYLLSHPCGAEGCGEADPVVLDFDHREPSRKRASVSHMIREGLSLDTIKTEIAKCQVLCANCHRRKTARERGYFRYSAAGGVGSTPTPSATVVDDQDGDVTERPRGPFAKRASR